MIFVYHGESSIDYSLYLVTDRDLCADRSIESVVSGAIAGGVTIVQLREKQATAREFVDIANDLIGITRKAGVPLIINDRVDVALAVGADGVHIGQDDMPAAVARRMIGPNMLLGVTVRNIRQLHRAVSNGADYVGTGPFADTDTKPDSPQPRGPEGLRAICNAANFPVVAIGGIDADNAGEAIAAGATGVAVVSAIMAADDPRSAAQTLRRTIDHTLETTPDR